MMDQTRKISIEWRIKGYAFHIRPHLDIELIVEPEENNRYDSNAMKVMKPSLNNIPSSMYGDEYNREEVEELYRSEKLQVSNNNYNSYIVGG